MSLIKTNEEKIFISYLIQMLDVAFQFDDKKISQMSDNTIFIK